MESVPPSTALQTATRPTRWYFLDWLRVAGLLLVFVFHCGRFFDHLWWHLKSPERDGRFTVMTLLLAQWVMPLFFLIAGAAAGLAHRAARGAAAFAAERARRLLVPFVFGVLVVVPPQVYLERLHRGEFHGSYLAFYPRYFRGLYFFGGNFSWVGHHLWFLPALFLVALATRPLLRAAVRPEAPLAARLAAACDRVGAPLFFGAPVLLAHLALRGVGLLDPVCFVLFYLYGALLAADPRFLGAIRRSGGVALTLALASSVAYALAFAAHLVRLDDLSRYSPRYALVQCLAGLAGWFWPHALLALASARLGRGNLVLRYANEAVMPVYVLHQTVILAVGYRLLAFPVDPPRTFATIAALALPLTLVVYEVLIRRFSVPRALFGMPPARAE